MLPASMLFIQHSIERRKEYDAKRAEPAHKLHRETGATCGAPCRSPLARTALPYGFVDGQVGGGSKSHGDALTFAPFLYRGVIYIALCRVWYDNVTQRRAGEG